MIKEVHFFSRGFQPCATDWVSYLILIPKLFDGEKVVLREGDKIGQTV